MEQRKASVLLSYIAQFIHILSALLYTPVMLRLLGQSEYGTYQLVESVVSYLSLFSLGFGASYVRYYSLRKAKNDEEGIAKLNGMYMVIFLIMALLVVICGLIMIKSIRALLGTGLNEHEYSIATILMCFMVFNLAITFPMSVFDCIVTAHERFIFQKSLMIFQYLLNPFITLPLLLMGYGSISMVAVTTGLTIAKMIANVWVCMKKLDTRFVFHDFQLSQFRDLWNFTFFIFLNQIIEQLNWNVDKFLLGRYTGTIAVSIYGLAAQINTLYIQFSRSISDAFIPKINAMVANYDDKDEINSLFFKVGRVQFIVIALILSGFIFFGETFMYLWGGEGYRDSYGVTLLLIIPITIPLIQGLGIQIQRARNKHRTRSIVYLFISMLNVIVSIPLVKKAGPMGAAFGTSVALSLGHGVFMNWYYYKSLAIDIPGFWKEIVSFGPALILPILSGIGLNILLPGEMIGVFILKILLYTIVYGFSMRFIGFNMNEKEMIRFILGRLKRGL